MVLFRKKKSKKEYSNIESKYRATLNNSTSSSNEESCSSYIKSQTKVDEPKYVAKQNNNFFQKKKNISSFGMSSIDVLPSLIDVINNSHDTCEEEVAYALRMLFSISEKYSHDNNREEMVNIADGQLVRALVNFLIHCDRSSSEQYLTLLILNNISIPADNKRVIAIDCGVVYKLCRLLCRDPSCHIIAIILVNLSFADTELRKQLVSSSKIELMDALSYSLWVACATPEEQLCRIPLEMDNIFLSPREILKQAMEQEYKYEEESSELYKVLNDRFFDTSRLLYPETARWCLCALKNLTRPAKDTAVAARELCRTGIVPLILRIITIAKIISDEYVDYEINSRNSSFLSIDEDSLGNMETLEPQYGNLPCTWLANSIQDVALFTILHLSAYQSVRNEILQMNIIQILSLIVDYPKNRFIENESNERAIANFQRLKARMALSYLLASEKHLGQQNDIFCTLRETESMLYVTAEEAELFVEVLSNVLHQRPKEGIGGYSAATFTIKGVIFSFRCLLTNFVNQRVFASVAGPNLNFLLFKAFALLMFGGQQTISFDAEMAEHLIFSLYLQSNLGFQETFLPSFVGTVKLVTLVKHVITAYIGLINITPAARFAANQILLRLDYLIFDGSTTDLVSNPDLDYELLSFIQKVPVPKQISGTKPISEIFDRPICRTKISNRSSKLLWKNSDEVEEFTNVLLAAQDISFCSLNHQDNINTHDVVEVANNVAITANREKSEYYNYLWCWKDEVLRIQCALPKNGSKSSRLLSCINGSTCNDDYEPFNIFGYQCGEI